MRLHFGTRLFWPFVRERGFGCLPMLGIAVGLISFIWSLSGGSWIWFGCWVLFLIVFFIIDLIRKRSLYKSVYSLVDRLVTVEGTIKGFFKPVNPESNSIQFDVIQRVKKGPMQ